MKQFILYFLLLISINTFSQADFKWKTEKSSGYEYRYVSNDPMRARFYTLKNGLTVILTMNHKEPRITYRMAVRAGSTSDPADHTGLAHYLEHLLFKGTQQYGSLDWSKEKPYLELISTLYEKYNKTRDTSERRLIYRQIDSISGIASQYAIANEYAKMMTDIGSQGTNAYTSVEQTVYVENIPSNTMDKFLAIQSERFRDPVFRLFHTELEAVYEEKNRGLDNDDYKMWEALSHYIFPTHNYGQQTTIGTIEHLKNPSLLAIRDFYNAYYVPNNMAVIFSGDFNADSLIGKIDHAFAFMQPKPVNVYSAPVEVPITNSITKEIFGPSAENVMIGFRTPAAGTRDALVLGLISNIFYNGKAGLLDLNLNKQQNVQFAQAGLQQFRDYGMMILSGKPKQGQTLEAVKDLLMQQIVKLQSGDFDEQLLKAITANNKLNELLAIEENGNRANQLVNAFIKSRGDRWDYEVAETDEESKIRKEEIVSVAKQWMGTNNYVLLYKRNGADNNIVKMVKPPITAIETNAGEQSDFIKKTGAIPLTTIKPVWLDFNTQMKKSTIGTAEVLYVPNTSNELFSLSYRFDMGKWNNRLLPLAASYMMFLGTDKYSAEEITRMFYSLACTYSVSVENEITTISLTGLQQNFAQATALLEDLLTHCKADMNALAALKDRLVKARNNAKLDKGNILRGLQSYAVYGAKNPFNANLTKEEIEKVNAMELVGFMHTLPAYKHMILYYGPMPLTGLQTSLTKSHALPKTFKAYPDPFKFTYQPTESKVLFAEYDMVQTEILWVNRGLPYDASKEALIKVFNNYFGGKMSSVVFQTIRESKALAYSTYSDYVVPEKKQDDFITLAYVGCQSDKMTDAINGMNALLEQMPVSQERFTLAKSSFKNDLETDRITKEGIMYAYLNGIRKGWTGDFREQEYTLLGSIGLNDVVGFHNSYISGKPYTYCVIGSEKKMDREALKKFGEVKTLSLEEIFGY